MIEVTDSSIRDSQITQTLGWKYSRDEQVSKGALGGSLGEEPQVTPLVVPCKTEITLVKVSEIPNLGMDTGKLGPVEKTTFLADYLSGR